MTPLIESFPPPEFILLKKTIVGGSIFSRQRGSVYIQQRQYYPGMDLYGHDSGHLLHTLLGLKGDPHFDVFHILSFVFIIGGLWMIASAWGTLYRAQKAHQLATSGLYAKIRHPQYDGFILVMIGFLLQWPTILTLIMFPILVYMYVRLARREAKEVLAEFGEEYQRYAAVTPGFIPRFGKQQDSKGGAP